MTPCKVFGAAGPPVVVLAELFGITPHVLEVCERLADSVRFGS